MNTNCLACLTNMSRYYENLDAFSSDRIVKLYEIFSKKITKTKESILRLKHGGDGGTVVVNLSGPNSTELELQAELDSYENSLQIVLEIINNTLTHKLTTNPALVYAILYKQELFDKNSNSPKFSDLISNIQKILYYFRNLFTPKSQTSGNKDKATSASDNNYTNNNNNNNDTATITVIEDKSSDSWTNKYINTSKEYTPQDVMTIISKGMPFWKADSLKAFPDLHYKYEEKDPAEFFTPYIWKIAISGTPGLYTWSLEELELFNSPSLDLSATSVDDSTTQNFAPPLSGGTSSTTPILGVGTGLGEIPYHKPDQEKKDIS